VIEYVLAGDAPSETGSVDPIDLEVVFCDESPDDR
jgi:hypothetical protein